MFLDVLVLTNDTVLFFQISGEDFAFDIRRTVTQETDKQEFLKQKMISYDYRALSVGHNCSDLK